jgi:hypothetical protein
VEDDVVGLVAAGMEERERLIGGRRRIVERVEGSAAGRLDGCDVGEPAKGVGVDMGGLVESGRCGDEERQLGVVLYAAEPRGRSGEVSSV